MEVDRVNEGGKERRDKYIYLPLFTQVPNYNVFLGICYVISYCQWQQLDDLLWEYCVPVLFEMDRYTGAQADGNTLYFMDGFQELVSGLTRCLCLLREFVTEGDKQHRDERCLPQWGVACFITILCIYYNIYIYTYIRIYKPWRLRCFRKKTTRSTLTIPTPDNIWKHIHM